MAPSEEKAWKVQVFSGEQKDWSVFRIKMEAVFMKEGLMKYVELTDEKLETMLEEASAKQGTSGFSTPASSKKKQKSGLASLKVEEAKAGDDIKEQWAEVNAEIYSNLVGYTSGAALATVAQQRATRDGRKAWRDLITKYEAQGSLQKMRLHEEMANDKVGAKEDPDQYHLRMEERRRQLAAAGEQVSDEYMMTMGKKAMPSSYSNFVIALDLQTDMTYEQYKKHIQTFYQRHVLSSSVAENIALSAVQFKGRCWGCGQRGHVEAKCPKNSGGGAGGGGGGGGKGRGNAKAKIKCHHCGKTGHLEKQCWKKQKEEAETAKLMAEADVCLATINLEDGGNGEVWTLDSGATAHMVKTKKAVVQFESSKNAVLSANGAKVPSLGKGAMIVSVMDKDGQRVRMVLTDVLVVPGLGGSSDLKLLSIRKIVSSGGRVHFSEDGGTIETGGAVIPFYRDGNLFKVRLSPVVGGSCNEEKAYVAAAEAELWHRRTGHRNYADLRALGNKDVGIPKGLSHEDKCEVCELAKHKHVSFTDPVVHRAKEPLELVHTDVIGPMEVESMGGARYAIIFTDDKTRWCNVQFMADKSESLKSLQRYALDMSGLLKGRKVKKLSGLRSDNGGEYTGGDFMAWCKKEGIMQTFSGPYAPQQNGLAERSNRTVIEMTRAMLLDAGLGKELWAEVMNAAVYVINRMPSKAIDGQTPYHALFGKEANLGHLRVYGSEVFVHVYDGQRKKLDAKAWKGIMVGYDEHNVRCYRVLNPANGRVVRAVHLTFNEKKQSAKMVASIKHVKDLDVLIDSEPRKVKPKIPSLLKLPSMHDDANEYEVSKDKEEDSGKPVGASHDQHVGQPEIEEPVEPAKPSVWKWTEGITKNQDSYGRGMRVKAMVDKAMVTRARMGKLTPTDKRALFTGYDMDRDEYLSYMAEHGGLPEKARKCSLMPVGARKQYLTDLAEEQHRACLADHGEPASVKEAKQSADWGKWKAAMDSEFQSLMETKTWTLCSLPDGANVIDTKWVFKAKQDETGKVVRHKARLVARGFTQEEGLDYFDTYAPVARISSIRTVLAIAAKEDFELVNMDVDTAFLQSSVEEEVYVSQPPEYEQRGTSGEKLVCKLHKSLYGLKQAPRNWNKTIDEWLREYGLEPSHSDACVYVMICEDGTLVVVLYVDDLIIAGSNKQIVDDFKQAIAERFQMKDLGELKWILGMSIKRNRQDRTLEVSQGVYIERMLERYGMADCKPVATPGFGDLSRVEGEGHANKLYRGGVGSLIWTTMTRPEIAYPVQVLSRYMQASGDEHWMAAKRVMRYLKGTRDLGIKYGVSDGDSLILEGYCDADWGNDKDTRRSTTGYVFQLAGGSISWASKLQPTVALSSTEAEYMALSAGVQEALYLRQLLEDLGYQQKSATVIREDNQGCIALAGNPIHHRRTKHIDIRYHFVRERIESGEIKVEYVPTEHQLADLLTKALPRDRMVDLRDRVMGYKL